jgi:hypothetical protein
MADFGFVEGLLIGPSLAAAARRRGERGKVFDWHKAAQILKERNPGEAEAGLAGDWPSTGGVIWRDGQPVPADDTYTYLASSWATPQLDIDGERIDCFVYEDKTTWDSGTYWPESALEILRSDA